MSEAAELLTLDEVAYLGQEALRLLEHLFEPLDDVVYFVKDGAGRYRSANRSLWRRCGLARREELLGRTARDLFPATMGEAFLDQDRQSWPAARPCTASWSCMSTPICAPDGA